MVILRCYSFVTGGRNGVEWVASLLWNQWPEWSRMGGRNGVEYAQFMQIGIFLAYDGFISVLEKLTMASRHR